LQSFGRTKLIFFCGSGSPEEYSVEIEELGLFTEPLKVGTSEDVSADQSERQRLQLFVDKERAKGPEEISVIVPSNVNPEVQNPPDSAESLRSIINEIKSLRSRLGQQIADDFTEREWGDFARSFNAESDRITTKIDALRRVESRMVMSEPLTWLNYAFIAAASRNADQFRSDSGEYSRLISAAERFIEARDLDDYSSSSQLGLGESSATSNEKVERETQRQVDAAAAAQELSQSEHEERTRELQTRLSNSIILVRVEESPTGIKASFSTRSPSPVVGLSITATSNDKSETESAPEMSLGKVVAVEFDVEKSEGLVFEAEANGTKFEVLSRDEYDKLKNQLPSSTDSDTTP
jgi:hypothetical protein